MSQDFEQMGIDFQNNLKEFIKGTDRLSKNALGRVQKALAAYPLEEGIITLAREDEKEVYDLGVEIQSIKLNMMVESLRQDAEEARVAESKAKRKPKLKKEEDND